MATDPVCGMYVDEKSSTLNSEREGRKYYFCSASCKLQFEKPERELKNLKISLAVSWPVTIVVALITYLIHFGYGNYILFILASIVQFYSGQRFYAGMIDAVKNRSSNMDMLIGIGTSAAWGYSTIVTFFPPFHCLALNSFHQHTFRRLGLQQPHSLVCTRNSLAYLS